MINQYTIHIPTHYNDLSPISDNTLNQIKTEALSMFGGYTYNPNVMQGAWRDDKTGEQYLEGMTQLIIATDDAAKAEQLAALIGTVTLQKCVYIVMSGLVQFIEIRKAA